MIKKYPLCTENFNAIDTFDFCSVLMQTEMPQTKGVGHRICGLGNIPCRAVGPRFVAVGGVINPRFWPMIAVVEGVSIYNFFITKSSRGRKSVHQKSTFFCKFSFRSKTFFRPTYGPALH